MCGCGCAEHREPLYRLEGPPGFFYIGWWYRGCIPCDAPPAFDLEKYPNDAPDAPELLEIAEPKWVPYGDSVGQKFEVIGLKSLQNFLKDQFKVYGQAIREDPGMGDDLGAEILAEETFGDLLRLLGQRKGTV